MAIACGDTKSLLAAAKCYKCLTGKQRHAAIAWLLCQWVNANPVNLPMIPTGADIADASTFSNIVVTWNPNAVQPTSYEVWRSINGGVYALFTTVAGNVTTATDAGPMGGDAIWTYKVRAVLGAFNSGFSNTVSIGNDLVDSHGVNAVFPDMVVLVGLLNYDGSLTCVSLSFPVLRISDSLSLRNLGALASFSAPKLAHVTNSGQGGFINIVAPPASFTALDLSKLVTVDGVFVCRAGTGPAVISLPALTTVGSDVDFSGLSGMVTFSAPMLATIGALFTINLAPNLTTISAPNLISTGSDLSLSNNAVLVNLTLTSLQTIGGGFLVFQNSNIVTISLPSIITITLDFDCGACNSLVTVDLSPLSSSGNGGSYFGGGSNGTGACPLLTTVLCPNVLWTDFITADFTGDALNAASVNNILARGVASGTTMSNYELSGGTNAAPSGAGIANKATLIGLGNTVNTN